MDIVRWVFVWALNLCSLVLLARVLASWIDPNTFHPVSRVLHRITEPVLAPIRRFMPRDLPVDLSPLVLFLLLTLLSRVIAII